MRKICLLSFIALIALISSCKKDNTIGADLLPADDLLNAKFTDTFSINVKTVSDTFLRSDKMVKNYLGVINDVLFGFQKAGIAMELDRPTGIFDDTLGPFVVDSVVLFLKYSSVYGDTLTPQKFVASELSTKINETQVYYSNTSLTTFGAISNVTDYLYTPTRNPVHISITDTIGTVGLIRIKLDDAFGQKIMNLGQSKLRDSSLFKNEINGILVENADNSGKAMSEIDLSSLNSNVTIFYKNKYGKLINSKLFTNLYRFVNGAVVPQTNSINLFSNNFSGTPLNNVLTAGAQNDSVNYMLGQGGTLIKVSLPTLANLGKVAVNKAVLQVTQIMPNSNLSFTSPATAAMFLVKRSTDGNLDFIPSNIAPFYNGYSVVDSVGTDIAGNKFVRYSINVSKHIQDISKGTESNVDLYLSTYRTGGSDGTKNLLSTYNFGYTPLRVILAGSDYSDVRYKMKLNLTYTLIK